MSKKLPYPSGPRRNLNREQLNPPTPSICIKNEAEVSSPQLQEFCLAHPIAVIRNICHVLDLNLGLFSTKTLVDADADHQIEIRTQLQQPSDQNWDLDQERMIWRCESPRYFTKIGRYAAYQANIFQEYLRRKNHKTSKTTNNHNNHLHETNIINNNRNNNNRNNNNRNNQYHHINNNYDHTNGHHDVYEKSSTRSAQSDIDFGTNGDYSSDNKKWWTQSDKVDLRPPFPKVDFATNVDLSDTKKWHAQMYELDKLPPFARVVSASNMLTHVGHSILGMNTVQLYMKVPGCRTPGHQENNNFCSVNINIGPGDCEWFGVPEEYWGDMAKLCDDNKTNFVHGSWWPNLDDLLALNVPVYRFIQKAGDLVWVNTGTVHWVQAIGCCNNIAWNVGPITTKQYKSAIERYEWNKLELFKSIVPMTHLTWNLARNVEIHDEPLFHMIKQFMKNTLDYCEELLDHLKKIGKGVKWHGKAENECAHYCKNCQAEVFNILFVATHDKKLYVVYCFICARESSRLAQQTKPELVQQIKPELDDFTVLQEFDMNYLYAIYNNFIKSFNWRRIIKIQEPPNHRISN